MQDGTIPQISWDLLLVFHVCLRKESMDNGNRRTLRKKKTICDIIPRVVVSSEGNLVGLFHKSLLQQSPLVVCVSIQIG